MPENIWPQYRDRIAGGWKCITYELFSPDQKLISKRDNPLGRVLISPNAYLSAHIARAERLGPLPSSKPWQEGGDAEVALVARGLSMYCGYLELFEDEGGLWWQTRVEVASDPSRVGGLEVRRAEYWEEEGRGYMVLRPERDMVLEDGTRARAVIKWEKFE